jgi:hypothetical protein
MLENIESSLQFAETLLSNSNFELFKSEIKWLYNLSYFNKKVKANGHRYLPQNGFKLVLTCNTKLIIIIKINSK